MRDFLPIATFILGNFDSENQIVSLVLQAGLTCNTYSINFIIKVGHYRVAERSLASESESPVFTIQLFVYTRPLNLLNYNFTFYKI